MEILRRITPSIIIILFFFVTLFIYTKIAGPIPFNINSVTTSKSDAFSVTGEGRVEAAADSATVRLGVVARAATAEAAREALNSNINRVIEQIEALGVPKSNIKTENFNIYPEYGDTRPLPANTPVSDQNRITGYNANTNISVMIDSEKLANQVQPASLANKIVDAGTAAGANQVGGVDFQVKNKDEALNKAREMAVADAKKKAEDASRIAGFKLGNIINYSEGQGGGYPPVMAMKAEDARGGSATNIQPGTNEITVTVTLSYEIR